MSQTLMFMEDYLPIRFNKNSSGKWPSDPGRGGRDDDSISVITIARGIRLGVFAVNLHQKGISCAYLC